MISGDEDSAEAFPPGDGTAETDAIVTCPHCGEVNEILLDPGGGSRQLYVEDCQVCCAPWTVEIRYGPRGEAAVSVKRIED